MSDCSNWRGDQIKATVEQEFRERRSEDSGARSVRGRQPERMLRVIAETTERVDVFRTRRVRPCLSLSVNKIHPSLHEPTLSASFLPCELCYTGAETREGSRNAAAIMSSPTGSPFAVVIQSLAGLHQEHHKALMDMRADQERRFCALVQNQREDRELFRSWMDREVRAGENPTAPAPPTHMPVQKMGPQDDPEAFLDLFEKTAVACGWPQTDWPVRLIPLLTGEAQLAAQQLPVQNLLVYDDVKRAILQRVGRSPEQHRQRFRSLELGENGRPFVMAHQLQGRLPQMAVGRGRRQSTKSSTGWCWSNLLRGSLRRPRSGSSATARRRWTWPSNSLRTRWWRATGLAKPYRPSLSLSPPLLCLPLSSYPGPVPAWFPEPSPDGEEDRHRSRRPGELTPGRRGQPGRAPRLFPFLRGLHANSLSHFPPLGWRGSLGRPVGVAGTRATSSIGVQ